MGRTRRFLGVGGATVLAFSLIGTTTAGAAPVFQFTTLSGPSGAVSTMASGINNAGMVVGTYDDSSLTTHGFLYSGGGYTPLDAPNGVYGTSAYGINNSNTVVGSYSPPGSQDGFVKFPGPGSGSYVSVSYLGATTTALLGANDNNQYVGTFAYPGMSGAQGFVVNGNGNGGAGNPANYAFLNAGFRTVLDGINNADLIVGHFSETSGFNFVHSFLYIGGLPPSLFPPPSDFIRLDDPNAAPLFAPGAQGTFAEGINNAGQVVGYYYDANQVAHGFLYTGGLTGATNPNNYLTIDAPGATSGTFLTGINDEGQIVGYVNSPGLLDSVGFIATAVPEPLSAVLAAQAAVASLAVALSRRLRRTES